MRCRQWARRALLGALLLTLLAPPAAAEVVVPRLPDLEVVKRDIAAAQKSYKAANKAFRKRRYKKALMHVKSAYQLNPNASTAIIQGVVLDKLKRTSEAFEAFLVALNLDPTADEQRVAKDNLRRLAAAAAPQLGFGTIHATPVAARITVDGIEVKRGVVLGLSVGSHAVRLSAPDHEAQEHTVEVEVGQQAKWSWALVNIKPADPPPDPDLMVPTKVEKRASNPPDLVVPVTLMAIGVAIAGAGGGLHAFAADRAKTAETINSRLDLSVDERRALHDDAVGSGEAGLYSAFASYGIGAALVITGVVLLALDDGSPATETAPTVQPTWIPGKGAGVMLNARF